MKTETGNCLILLVTGDVRSYICFRSVGRVALYRMRAVEVTASWPAAGR